MVGIEESEHLVPAGAVWPLPRVSLQPVEADAASAQRCVQMRGGAIGAAVLIFVGALVCLVGRPLSHVLRGTAVQQDTSAGFISVIEAVADGDAPNDDDGEGEGGDGSAEPLTLSSSLSKDKMRQMKSIADTVESDRESIREALRNAEIFRKKAEDHRVLALEKLQQAKAFEAKAVKAKALAQHHQDDARDRVEKAARLMQKGRTMDKRVSEILAEARMSEVNAREEVYFFRVCVDLVGVRLTGSQLRDFSPMLPAPESTPTWDHCQARCQKHTSCRQAVFSGPKKECLLYHGATILPLAFESTSNSSYCGSLESKYDMLDMVRVVVQKEPASFDDPAVEIPPALPDAPVMGTSLFCFTVVLAIDAEKALAENIKQQQLSICRCDESLFVNAPSGTSMGDTVEPFIKAWALVGSEDIWQGHDWTVKVDPDAVFFPIRLRKHLEALRTPEGAAVYVRNSDTQFHLIGTIEAMSREAMRLHYLRADRCRYDTHSRRGEDGWLRWCLETIGVDFQTDLSLLSRQLGDCTDEGVAAFPFYNSTPSWNKCHMQAEEAERV